MAGARRGVEVTIAIGRGAVVAALVAGLAGGCVLPGRAAPVAYTIDGLLVVGGGLVVASDAPATELLGWANIVAGVSGAVMTTILLVDGAATGARDAALRVEVQRLDGEVRAAARAGRCLDAARRLDRLRRLDRGYAAEVLADDRAVADCLTPTVGPGAD